MPSFFNTFHLFPPHFPSALLGVICLLTSAQSVTSTALLHCLTFTPSSLPTSMSAFSPCPSVSIQACELHVAGYRFSVLSSAFVVHRGFKIQGEFHARKDEENKHNRVLFRSFKEGLKTKYPSSNRRC